MSNGLSSLVARGFNSSRVSLTTVTVSPLLCFVTASTPNHANYHAYEQPHNYRDYHSLRQRDTHIAQGCYAYASVVERLLYEGYDYSS